APDGRYHDGRVFDGTVRDGIRGEGRNPQRGQRVGPARLLDVDGLHTARADVEAEDFQRLAEERHIKSLSPCWLVVKGAHLGGANIFPSTTFRGLQTPGPQTVERPRPGSRPPALTPHPP